MKPKTLLMGLLAALPVSLLALVAWAFFWPEGACSDPACSRIRFNLFVELDTFRGIEPIPLEVEADGTRYSVRDILRSGGLDVQIQLDDDSLPYSPDSGPLDRADLYQYALAWRNLAPPARADAQIYALVAPSIVSERGEALFGIMFDSAGREGVAIAPLQTVRTFEAAEFDSIPLLQLRTFVHEMLHALNRRHIDAVQMPDGRITLEAPTRCLMIRAGNDWRLTERPLMALSPGTIQFFQTAEARRVLPGSSNTPFEGLGNSATECADVRARVYERSLASRWEFAKRRLFAIFGIASAEAQEDMKSDEDVQDDVPPVPVVRLQVQAQEAAYPLAYPIAVRIMAGNESDHALPLKNRLAPEFGLIQIEYRFAGDGEWRVFQPLTRYEPADDEAARLEPGESTEHTAPIYFGDKGWTFPQPGDYELRAVLKAPEHAMDITSDVVHIRIAPPQSDADLAVLQPLLDEAGMLDADIGRWLTFDGRIGDAEALSAVAHAVEQYPHTALGSALRLALAAQRLRPPIDPRTGERPAPDVKGAHALLDDLCSDSGVAALKHELLLRLDASSGATVTDPLVSGSAAWDGTTRTRTLPTYSDEKLKRAPVTLHFCRNEAALKDAPRRRAARIARTLTQAKRIVLVGHTDHTGTCRFNDTLALRRAQAVKDALVAAGITRRKIEIASLGERRPLEFFADDEHSMLNRRVEILYEPQDDVADEEEIEAERVEPECG